MPEDPILILTKIGRDLLPTFLPESRERFAFPSIRWDWIAAYWQLIAVEVDQHPLFGTACHLLTSDPTLRNLMRDPEVLVWLTGRGYEVTPKGLVSGLMAASARELVYVRQRADVETLTELLKVNYSRLRKIAQGNGVRSAIVMGLTGVAFPDEGVLRTPWGPVCKVSPNTAMTASMERRTEAVFVIHCSLAPQLAARQGPGRIAQQNMAAQRKLDRAYLLLRLAFTLAFRQREHDVPTFVWQAELLPIGGGLVMSPYTGLHIGGHMVPANRDKVLEWCDILDERHPDRLTVAAERLVSARADREAPNDALIDAVVSWESMCGATPETTFRLTAALAKLIQPPESRDSLMRELQTIYRLRSGLVHGRNVKADDARRAADRALQVACDGLSELYRNRYSLLPLTSDARSNQLLLREP